MQQPNSEETETGENDIQSQLDALKEELGEELDTIATELASEISREQEHLLLMQDQVDKQKNMLQKDLMDLAKKLEQERTQRTLALAAQNDTIRDLQNGLTQREADIKCLEERIVAMETQPGAWATIWGAAASCCGFRYKPRSTWQRNSSPQNSAGLDVGGEELLEPLALQ